MRVRARVRVRVRVRARVRVNPREELTHESVDNLNVISLIAVYVLECDF